MIGGLECPYCRTFLVLHHSPVEVHLFDLEQSMIAKAHRSSVLSVRSLGRSWAIICLLVRFHR